MFPKLTTLNYSFFINQLKINLAQKNFFFNCRCTKRIEFLVKLLYKLGIIRRYIKITSSLVRIFPNWIGGRSTLNSIRFFQTKTPLKLRYQTLRLLKYYTFSSYIVLETSQGLVTHQEALRHKVGGNLICVII